MQLRSQPATVLGSESPVLQFGTVPTDSKAWGGMRMVFVEDGPAFYLMYPCGTCPILFLRIADRPQRTLSLDTMQDRLNEGLDDIDPAIVERFGDLLPQGPYLPMLIEIQPELVLPDTESDYFTHELRASWGDDGSFEDRTGDDAYYRTFATAIEPRADDEYSRWEHLYEFVVPMVPPSWNDPERVAHYRDLLATSNPTAVAVSVLDTSVPVRGDNGDDFYTHWGLIHFLLDGHHKLAAAAETGQSLQLLSLLATNEGMAAPWEIERIPAIRSQEPSVRQANR